MLLLRTCKINKHYYLKGILFIFVVEFVAKRNKKSQINTLTQNLLTKRKPLFDNESTSSR